jgi:hypothetical protein
VLIDLHARAEQKTEATATTTGTGAGMYGRYGGYHGRYGYGGGFTTTTVDYNNYVEGTLFIDVVDKAEEQNRVAGAGELKPWMKLHHLKNADATLTMVLKSIFAHLSG